MARDGPNATASGPREFSGGSQALEFILQSLTKRHSELLNILAKDALKQPDAADAGVGAGAGPGAGAGTGG